MLSLHDIRRTASGEFCKLAHIIFTIHIYDTTNFFAGHKKLSKYQTSSRQSVDWHEIRCLSHSPAATPARKLLLRAKMSICPPGTCESSPLKTHLSPPGSSPAQVVIAQTERIPLCNQLFSCLSDGGDYHFNPEMSHLQELLAAHHN